MGVLRRVWGQLKARVAAGLLLVIPVAITYLVLRFLWQLLYPLLRPLFELTGPQRLTRLEGLALQALVVVVIILVLYGAGWLLRTVVGRQAAGWWHGAMEHIPVVRPIYRVARLFTEMLSGTSELAGNRVVLMEYPRAGVLALGIVTGSYVTQDGERLLAVYIPTVPNPTSGFLALAAEEQVMDTDMTFDEMMRVILSGGLLIGEVSRTRAGHRGGLADEAAKERAPRAGSS